MGFTEETTLETKFGKLNVKFYKGAKDHYCVCIVRQPWGKVPFVRVQSSCLFSESFGGNDCDCARQLHSAIKIVTKEGGVIIYMFQEGRGLGLEGKIKALEIQRQHKLDTASAFKTLGKDPDPREYELALKAMRELGLPKSIALATNNPEKIRAIEDEGFKVVKRRKLPIKSNIRILDYLRMKQKVLKHYDHE